MRVLIDINHPAHVHFFRQPARLLIESGAEVRFTSRDKDVTLNLMNEFGFDHDCLSVMGSNGPFSLVVELLSRNWALYKRVKQFKPDVMLSIGGTFIAHMTVLTWRPSLVFYDTENAKLQNLITYPFASKVLVPQCYQAWLPKRHQRYAGYHELSYLHPDYFVADRAIALANGLVDGVENFIVRLVSWEANHDIGEDGWGPELLSQIIDSLGQRGNVMLVAEGEVSPELQKYVYAGKVSQIHHVMAFCRLFVGESATMASECAVLGVPAIYAAHTTRGYIVDQDQRYQLVRDLSNFSGNHLLSAIDSMLENPAEFYQAQRQKMLSDSIDVAAFVVEQAQLIVAER